MAIYAIKIYSVQLHVFDVLFPWSALSLDLELDVPTTSCELHFL